MNTTAQIRSPQTPSASEQPTERPGIRDQLAEIASLVEFVPYYGPPAVFLLGPWLFLVLMLAGPFACLFALLVVMAVVAIVLAALAAAIVALVTGPYRLVRHFRRHWARRVSISAPPAQVVAIGSRQVTA